MLGTSAAILGPRDLAPDFSATAVVGDKFETISLKQYLDAGKWTVLFVSAKHTPLSSQSPPPPLATPHSLTPCDLV